ncbi:hypothetical protein TRVL_05541 [Trypanosoma vivax]|nr:hypothetical protein TRVL_05541 [Trypanosoma vivax]
MVVGTFCIRGVLYQCWGVLSGVSSCGSFGASRCSFRGGGGGGSSVGPLASCTLIAQKSASVGPQMSAGSPESLLFPGNLNVLCGVSGMGALLWVRLLCNVRCLRFPWRMALSKRSSVLPHWLKFLVRKCRIPSYFLYCKAPCLALYFTREFCSKFYTRALFYLHVYHCYCVLFTALFLL